MKKKKKRKWDAAKYLEGNLAGHYLVIGKLFDTLAELGIFKTLPQDLQEHIAPSVLVEDFKKGALKRICLLRKAFRQASENIEYADTGSL